MNISDKEDQKTMGYQETLKTNVKNFDKNVRTTRRPLYDIMNTPFFEEADISPQYFKTYEKSSN